MYTEGSPDFVIDQGMYYPATNYGYYCTGYDSPVDWENHQVVFGVDGSEVQYTGGQNENSPYLCYTPNYGYAQSPYNPYNPYIPGASIGMDPSFVGFQQYYSIPPYDNAASSPTYLPYVVSNSPTDSLVGTDLANGGQSDGRGSRQRNASAIAGLPRNAPKPAGGNSLGRTYEKLRSNTGQNKQPGILKTGSTPASGHNLQGRTASVSAQPVDNVSSSRLLPYGQIDIAPPIHNGFSSVPSNSYKPRPKMYDGRGDNDAIASPDTSEQNRGPRTRRSRNRLIVKAYTTKAGNADAEGNIVINPDQYNKEDFKIDYSNAKLFVIKSYSEDDVHKSIKYGVWSSTLHGNRKLQSAYEDAQRIATEKSCECPIFLFFSVNASGLFCGVAEMTGPVTFDRDMDFWQQDKWSGSFPVKWHIIKDVPNSYLRHIILHNNENKPVTNSRDTQEIMLKQGLEVLKLFKDHVEKTSLLDDFMYYENRQRLMQEEKARLPYRTFRNPFPIPKPDFSDKNKKISEEDSFKKPPMMTSTETEHNLKIGSLTINSTTGPLVTTTNSNQTQTKSKPDQKPDQKPDPPPVEATGSPDDIVKVGSMPIKVKGSANSSPNILTVGTIPLDSKSLQK